MSKMQIPAIPASMVQYSKHWLKYIRKGWKIFQRHAHIVVGDGSRVRFWHDKWCGEQSLQATFPTIFELARANDAMITDLFVFSSGSPQWNVDFISVV